MRVWGRARVGMRVWGIRFGWLCFSPWLGTGFGFGFGFGCGFGLEVQVTG